MTAITLKARYDGDRICLDEPYGLQRDAKLLVTIVPGASLEEEHLAWLAASQAGLARAYGDDEPDYSDAVIRELPSRE